MAGNGKGCDSNVVTTIEDGWFHTFRKKLSFSFRWTISEFSYLKKEIGEYIESLTLTVGESGNEGKWCLRLYPNGVKQETSDFVGLFLMLRDIQGKEKFVEVTKRTLAILNSKGTMTNKFEDCSIQRYEKGNGKGYDSFVKREVLNETAADLLPNDDLTLYISATIVTKWVTTNSMMFTAEPTHFRDNPCLLDNMKLSDVTLVSRDKREFHAHKAILASRSPVFFSMFHNDMKENEENKVEIEDIDADILELFLKYLYTEKMQKICHHETVSAVLYAANKYGLEKLSSECDIILSSLLTVQSAAAILMTAEKHDRKDLKELTMKYILAHSSDVIQTKGWKSVETVHPQLAMEMYRVVALKK